jgi:hypothetical protein
LGSHIVATGFKAEGFKAAGLSAAGLPAWRLGDTAGLAKMAGFGEVTCFGDLACFDELLKTSDSQPASLASIGRSSNAAIAAMMVRRRGQTPKQDPANFLPDDSNRYFPEVILCARFIAASGIMNHE